MKTFKNNQITFSYPDTWESEKADTLNNPDCIATLSKGNDNLLNVVKFPTQTSLMEFKPNMEDMFLQDGGVIIESSIINIASKEAIYLHGNVDTVDINFDIHSFVFIENKIIYFFEFRTLEIIEEAIIEFKNIVNSFKVMDS